MTIILVTFVIVPLMEDVVTEVGDKAWPIDGDFGDANDNPAHDGPSGGTESR